MTPNCNPLQQNFQWCDGKPSFPGIKKRAFYIAKSLIKEFPKLEMDEAGRVKSSVLKGKFVLAADATWKVIDHLADKATFTSEAQGEVPSQTQLNKVSLVHAGVEEEATMMAACLNNSDNVVIVETVAGKFRVLGNDRYVTKTTVAQDNGQGATGSTSTTINVEVTDFIPAPFYEGEIVTDEGTINEAVEAGE